MSSIEKAPEAPETPDTTALAHRVTISEAVTTVSQAALFSKEGHTVCVSGWVHRIRSLGGITFVILRDRTGTIQLVYETVPTYTQESVIAVTGVIRKAEKAPGGYEIRVVRTAVLSAAAPDLPIAVNKKPESGIDTILDNRIISLRNPHIRGIFEVQAAIIHYFADYLRSQHFTEIKTSKLIGTGTEGGTGLFAVEYFDERVYLAQSPQFYKQAMVASGLERVFEIGAAYRAEKHETPRHLNEYVSLDIEMGFITGEHDLMDLEAALLSYIFTSLKTHYAPLLREYDVYLPAMQNIPRISYAEAKAIIKRQTGSSVYSITPEGERSLCNWAKTEHGVEAVFVYGFPRKKRPFYTYPNGTETRSFDLLFRGVEITTGGQRIHQYDMLQETLQKFGLTEEGLRDYCTIFKYGCPPHGGFAIGLERLTQTILGLQNVKEASLFPRDRKRTRP